jgi:excisionase family DNA binding protein
MTNPKSPDNNRQWLGLSEAAAILGVHFTTLRRWANEGQIACIRTPGGRRRFSAEVIGRFLHRRQQAEAAGLPAILENRIIDHTRHDIRGLNPQTETWMSLLSPEQKLRLRQTGHRLNALLLQFSTPTANGEPFLEEGKRIASEYGSVCFEARVSFVQTIRAFQFFQRSILDAVHETSFLGDNSDLANLELYRRASYFFDETLLAAVSQYLTSAQIKV